MRHKWSVLLDRLVIVLLAVILLVPPAALPFSEPVPQAFAQTYSPPTYLDSFGSKGNGNGEFGNNGPLGIAITPSGDVWIMDYKNEHAQKFTSDGDFILLIGSNGNADNQFKNNGPRDIAVDSTGSFWITDTKAHKIKKFNSDGTFALSIGSSSGDTDIKFKEPSGITVDSLDNVYVADTKNEKIKKYDSSGNHLLTFGSKGNNDGQFTNDGPIGIAVDSLGFIWVSDFKKHQIQKFDALGNFVLKFGNQGSGDTSFRQPNAIAIDSFDNVWIADTNNDRIVAYDSSGNFLTKYGTKNSSTGFEDNGPRGIAFESGTSTFYVADTKGNTIHKFKNNLIESFNVPGVPTDFTATPGDTIVSLTWVAPTDDGGVAIDYYKVLFREVNSGQWILTSDEITDTSAVVPGLTNDQEYEFAVFAHNSAGDGTAASVTATPVAGSETVPGVPTGLSATAGNEQVSLTWSAPSDGGSAITDYTIQYRATSVSVGSGQIAVCHAPPGNPNNTQTLVIPDSTITTHTSHGDTIGECVSSNPWNVFPHGDDTVTETVTGLTNDIEYEFRIIAVNSIGSSDPSTSVTATPIVVDSVPNAPTNLTAAAGASKVTLSWTAPVNNGGQSILDYLLQSSTNGGTTWTTITDEVGVKTSITVSGSDTTNGQQYTLRIFAVNAIGTSAASSTVNVTPISVPTAPRGLDTTSDSGEITLDWTAPLSDGGSPITSYVITSYLQDTDDSFNVINPTITHTPVTATTATVTGLTDGNVYRFTITAINDEGTGPSSSGSTETAGVPTAADDDNAFTSIKVTFLLGEKAGSVHPLIPTNTYVGTDAVPDFVCPEPQVYFIGNGETLFDGITVDRNTAGDQPTQCAYTAELQHFSTYGVNIINSKFAVGAAGLSLGATNIPLPPIISGLAMYSFGVPTLNEDGQLVFTKTGSYQSLSEYSQTLATTTLKVGEPSQIAVRIFDYNGPEAVTHVGLYLNLFGIEYANEDSDTYILYDKGEDFTLVDPHGLLSSVNVTPRIEGDLLWLLFDMTFEESLETSNINVNAWNTHRAKDEKIAYEILTVSDLIPEIEQIIGTSSGSAISSGAVDTSFYIVESVSNGCDACSSAFDIALTDNEIEWTNTDESIRTIITGDSISGFDGLFKSNFIFQDNSYSTTIEDTGYYTLYDILNDNYHSSMIVEVAGDPITDARLLEKATMPYNDIATTIISGSSSGVFGLDVSVPNTIHIFGNVYDVNTRQAVLLDVIHPDGTVTDLKLSTGNSGHFSTVHNMPDSWDDGVYTISFGITSYHISSIFFKLQSGVVTPLFTSATSVVESVEAIAAVTTPELTFLHAASLGRGGNLLIVEGNVDSLYSRVIISIQNPDGTIDEYWAILNSDDKYSLPLLRTEWQVGKYTATVSDESNEEFASESFTVFEAEKSKSALDLAFEAIKTEAPIVINNALTEVVILDSDYYDQLDEYSGESEFGTLVVTRPDITLFQSTLDISGTVNTVISGVDATLVEITLTNPDGDIEELSTLVTKQGEFHTLLVESWLTGEYTLHASYGGNPISDLTFFIGEKSTADDTISTCPTSDCVSIESADEVLTSSIMVIFTGDVENTDTSIQIDVKIVRPDNTSIELSSMLSTSGELESPIILSEQWISGVYTVIVSYGGDQLSAASFRK